MILISPYAAAEAASAGFTINAAFGSSGLWDSEAPYAAAIAASAGFTINAAFGSSGFVTLRCG